MQRSASIFFVLILAFGCGRKESEVKFEQPQPSSIKNITKFPKSLQGIYINAGQTLLLKITQKTITQRYDYFSKILKDSLNDFELKGNTLIDKQSGEKFKVALKDDTVIYHFVGDTDTIFSISPENILKKYKGHYFLNIQAGKSQWSVNKLSKVKNKLTLGIISDSAEIAQLKNITRYQEGIDSIFNPSKKEFKSFIKNNGFRDEETFFKISSNPGS